LYKEYAYQYYEYLRVSALDSFRHLGLVKSNSELEKEVYCFLIVAVALGTGDPVFALRWVLAKHV
jgi:hypothetical protein